MSLYTDISSLLPAGFLNGFIGEVVKKFSPSKHNDLSNKVYWAARAMGEKFAKQLSSDIAIQYGDFSPKEAKILLEGKLSTAYFDDQNNFVSAKLMEFLKFFESIENQKLKKEFVSNLSGYINLHLVYREVADDIKEKIAPLYFLISDEEVIDALKKLDLSTQDQINKVYKNSIEEEKEFIFHFREHNTLFNSYSEIDTFVNSSVRAELEGNRSKGEAATVFDIVELTLKQLDDKKLNKESAAKILKNLQKLVAAYGQDFRNHFDKVGADPNREKYIKS